jgi:histidinol-phosphate aminotransferase
MSVNRRDWLKKTSLAAFGLSLGLPSIANEEGVTRTAFRESGMINLGSNENPYGISPKAKQAILDMLPEANRYQFNVPSVRNFRKPLAEHYGFAPENVLVTAGSGDALSLFARHFQQGNIVLANPTFGILGNTAKRLGTQLVEVPLTYDKVHDLPAMLKAINDKTSLVYIVNPANPTSTIINSNTLKDFCREASKKAVVLVDEAYVDFLDDPKGSSVMDLIPTHPNVAVVRTFSKIYAMAGMRVGFVLAHPALISKLEQNYFGGTQYTVSNLSLAAAMASLDDQDHARKSRELNATARNFTQQALKEKGIRYIPSYTNFIFFELKDYKGDFAQEMMKKNILLRTANYDDGKWCRVSVGTMEEMKEFNEKCKM